MAAANAKPLKEITVMTSGSRGDMQPYLALSIGLTKAGYSVTVVTNKGYKPMVESFGVRCLEYWPDLEKFMQESSNCREAMNTGDLKKFVAIIGEVSKSFAADIVRDVVNYLKTSKVDLLVSGTQGEYFELVAKFRLKIPLMPVKTGTISPLSRRAPFGLPTLPFRLHNYILESIIASSAEQMKPFDDELKKQFGLEPVYPLVPKSKLIRGFREGPTEPSYVMQSTLIRDILTPGLCSMMFHTGQCIIPNDAQQSHKDSFGDTKAMETFIAACSSRGAKPVYCGWGSMTCKSPEYMVELVTKALMLSKQPGIVLSGWAKLSMETLQQSKDESLLAYARDHIIFVESAPHEWLFPQVACTVHHGGAGTMNTALRAGVPTIITPVWLDQWDHSYLVNELGVGVGLSKQFQQTSAEALSDVIKKVLDDKAMAAKAKEVAAKLLAEDGVTNLVKEIEKWWINWELTGKHSADTAMHLQEAEDASMNSGGLLGCCKPKRVAPVRQEFADQSKKDTE